MSDSSNTYCRGWVTKTDCDSIYVWSKSLGNKELKFPLKAIPDVQAGDNVQHREQLNIEEIQLVHDICRTTPLPRPIPTYQAESRSHLMVTTTIVFPQRHYEPYNKLAKDNKYAAVGYSPDFDKVACLLGKDYEPDVVYECVVQRVSNYAPQEILFVLTNAKLTKITDLKKIQSVLNEVPWNESTETEDPLLAIVSDCWPTSRWFGVSFVVMSIITGVFGYNYFTCWGDRVAFASKQVLTLMLVYCSVLPHYMKTLWKRLVTEDHIGILSVRLICLLAFLIITICARKVDIKGGCRKEHEGHDWPGVISTCVLASSCMITMFYAGKNARKVQQKRMIITRDVKKKTLSPIQPDQMPESSNTEELRRSNDELRRSNDEQRQMIDEQRRSNDELRRTNGCYIFGLAVFLVLTSCLLLYIFCTRTSS